MLADNFLGAEPDEGSQTEKNNQQIIDLTEPYKKIGQKINRRDNVGQQKDEEEFRPRGDTGVFQQPPEKFQKIR